jgi:hypothetical protein
MAAPHAIHYREKARELYEMAASASTGELRNQLATLARQYERLATSVETTRVSRPAVAPPVLVREHR